MKIRDKIKTISMLFFLTGSISMDCLADNCSLEDFDMESHSTQYNALPKVEDSDRARKAFPHFGCIVEEVGRVLTHYQMEEDLGLRLLHRHWLLKSGQLMVERSEHIDSENALVTSARSLTDATTDNALPASWFFGSKPNAVYLFESSLDSAVSLECPPDRPYMC